MEVNAQTGNTVTMDLGNGYEAVYGQLKEVPVQEGNYVEQGELVGYLSELQNITVWKVVICIFSC